MTISPYLLGIEISNFRSIVESVYIPLQKKMTFLVGQNNSGKTGILRFLGLLLNGGAVGTEDISQFTKLPANADYVFSNEAIFNFANNYPVMTGSINEHGPNQFKLSHDFEPNRELKISEDLLQIINTQYFHPNGGFFRDFSQSSSLENNISLFIQRFWSQTNIPKTIYVPGQRAILSNGTASGQFGQVDFPGQRIQLNTIVSELAVLDRPDATEPEQRVIAKNKLTNICKFLTYCLEVQSVKIEVPDGKRTIYVTIDGIEQPISNLGSGIEQLIVIAMGSFMFPDHLVLIDEPELHFHPRTQKRMMKYLFDNADAKFIIATHSAAILDSVEADIVQVSQENHRCIGRTIQGNSDRYEAVRHLGHSPSELVLANFVIWVEGPSDRVYFNHWIQKLDPDLLEGTDYAIIFYGGAILARHEFDDGDQDLVKALSIARNFAVYMDSDKASATAELKARVIRVSDEVTKNSGLCWVSAGREIENYIPESVLEQITNLELNLRDQFGHVVKSVGFDKVKFAETAAALWGDEWPFDLKEKCQELVDRIRKAR
jgi:predicted ATPase